MEKIKTNEDNNLKFMTGELSEEEKKKKEKENKDSVYTESADDGPLEYFTE